MARAILLDIEGTTTPIDFVHKTLFPYAAEHVGRFIAEHIDQLDAEINILVDEHARDASYTLPLEPREPGSVAEYLRHLIAEDRKSTPLKAIQGRIWRKGYENGELRSKVFDDVPTALKQWNDSGTTVAIYSSGSVLAQQLLFRHTNHGDLTPHISNYFDTTTGPKRETASYAAIAAELETLSDHIVFISDVKAELDAARAAGLQTVLAVRPGNAGVDDLGGHHQITTFADLNF